MLLGNQRLRELRYEDRLPSEPSAEQSASAVRDVQQGPEAKSKREPTLLGVGALEKRRRDPTLVGVGLATPAPVPTEDKGARLAEDEAAGTADRSTDETIPRLEQTCDVSLGEMEVLAAQRAADSTEQLSFEDDELKEDTQGEWIRFEKSFANVTIATIVCAILAFFLLPSGHDAPVPPPAAKDAKRGALVDKPQSGQPTAAVAPVTSAIDLKHEKTNAAATNEGAADSERKGVAGESAAAPSTTATKSEESALAPGHLSAAEASERSTSTPRASAEHALRIETAQDLTPEQKASVAESAVEKPKRRARTPEERKELRKKRREARAKREALAKQEDTVKRESSDKRRKTISDSVSKRARSGGKS